MITEMIGVRQGARRWRRACQGVSIQTRSLLFPWRLLRKEFRSIPAFRKRLREEYSLLD